MFQQTNEITLWSLNHYVLCAVVVLVVVILVVVFYSWIYLKRAKEANIRQKEQNGPMKEGKMVDLRDQVLRTFFSPVLFISATLLSSSGAA